MNQKSKNIAIIEASKCERYVNRLLKQQKSFATKTSPAPSNIEKPTEAKQQRQKSTKISTHKQGLPGLPVIPLPSVHTDHSVDTAKESINIGKPPGKPITKTIYRSRSHEREPWGKILQTHKTKERPSSSFSTFDPLRTLHFLSKELHTKLHAALPAEHNVLQMVSDIQHTLKRIPPDVSGLVRTKPAELLQGLESNMLGAKPTVNKINQTPPTLYQEDTEKFQKIMEENTYRLEASCKQLEAVCTNLQHEKEVCEKELEDAKNQIDTLLEQIKELEIAKELSLNEKIQELETENKHLQEELDRVTGDERHKTMCSLQKLVDDLKQEKITLDDTCRRLEYDMTIVKMEKEKFATMLNIRDREVKEIQEEMAKVQEQVTLQLNKLNEEVLSRVNSTKIINTEGHLDDIQDKKGPVSEVGDATISSIKTNESEKDILLQCGDVMSVDGKDKEISGDTIKQITSGKIELPPFSKEQDVLEELLKELSPTCKALIKASSDKKLNEKITI